MLIQLLSDLHIEFAGINIPKTNADVIVLAGDIGVGFVEEITFCKDLAQEHSKPIVFILGNHSFYQGGNIDEIRTDWLDSNASDFGVHFLDDDVTFTHDNVTFIGGILWTDFNGYNKQDMENAKWCLNDYHGVHMNGPDGSVIPFVPERSVDEHYNTKNAINKSLEESTTKNVVVTHMAPSALSTHPKYAMSPVNPAFRSHMDDWVKERDIALWLHGHSHESCDYVLGNTHVVCNPRGYHRNGINENSHFLDDLVIEV
jgi:predicted phosphodiesterase